MRGFFKTSRHRICYIYWAVPCVMWFKCHVDAMLKFHAEVPCCSAWLRLPEEMCIRISSFSCLFIHHMNHYYLHMLEFRVNYKQYTHVYTLTSDQHVTLLFIETTHSNIFRHCIISYPIIWCLSIYLWTVFIYLRSSWSLSIARSVGRNADTISSRLHNYINKCSNV